MPIIQSNPHLENSLDKLRFKFEEHELYKAGLPGFPRTFTRDVIISAILMSDAKMLKDSLIFGAKKQGIKKDPITGEQPGVIFHEYDQILNNGVELSSRPGFTTFYNASDTTGLFLLGHKVYRDLTGDKWFGRKYFENIARAADYILTHLNQNSVFVEDPKFSDAKTYALKVTYWKDSMLFDREGGEPSYPIVYPLVHIQNFAGLRAAAEILESSYLKERAEEMRKAIISLYNHKLKNFPVAIDTLGEIAVSSSDGLNSLFYLEPEDISNSIIEEIIASSETLETDFGYRTLDKNAAEKVSDSYHARTVWTQEQAQIHMGALKFYRHAVSKRSLDFSNKLFHVLEVSQRVNSFLTQNLGKYPEIFIIEKDKIIPGGNDPQLWAVAAKKYFDSASF